MAIDKKFLPGSGDPPLGDSRTVEQQADLQSAAVYGHLPKKNIPALTGDIHLCPPLATHLHLRLMQLREPWAECSERAAASA